jgi:hypothetical protein
MRMTITIMTIMTMRTTLITQRTTDHRRKTPTFGAAPDLVMPVMAASAVRVVTSTTPVWTAVGLTAAAMVVGTAVVEAIEALSAPWLVARWVSDQRPNLTQHQLAWPPTPDQSSPACPCGVTLGPQGRRPRPADGHASSPRNSV